VVAEPEISLAEVVEISSPPQPVPNAPPANPNPGEVFTLQIVPPEPERRPGETLTVPIPLVGPGPKPGTLTALTWRPVTARPNPHK
jgi:hypothetical protein